MPAGDVYKDALISRCAGIPTHWLRCARLRLGRLLHVVVAIIEQAGIVCLEAGVNWKKAFPSYWRVDGVIGIAYGAVLKAPGEALGAPLSRHTNVPMCPVCASMA